MSNTKNLITGIIGGLAVGATLGILFAPHKGSKTRKLIKKSADEAKDTVVHKTQEFKDQLSHVFHSKKDEFEDELDRMVNNMSGKADDVINALEHKLAELKKENEHFRMMN